MNKLKIFYMRNAAEEVRQMRLRLFNKKKVADLKILEGETPQKKLEYVLSLSFEEILLLSKKMKSNVFWDLAFQNENVKKVLCPA